MGERTAAQRALKVDQEHHGIVYESNNYSDGESPISRAYLDAAAVVDRLEEAVKRIAQRLEPVRFLDSVDPSDQNEKVQRPPGSEIANSFRVLERRIGVAAWNLDAITNSLEI